MALFMLVLASTDSSWQNFCFTIQIYILQYVSLIDTETSFTGLDKIILLIIQLAVYVHCILLHNTPVHTMKQMQRSITHSLLNMVDLKKDFTSSTLIIPEHEVSLHPGSDQMREMSVFDRQCCGNSLPVI